MTLAHEFRPMPSRKEREKTARAATNRRRAETYAARRGVDAKPKPANDLPHPEAGLEWMLRKRKINQEQSRAGKRYGHDYRCAATDGVVPLKSCLNDEVGGGGAAILTPAESDIEARHRLLGARHALAFQSDLIAACDLVCGREMSPWDVVRANGGTQRDAEQIVTTLRIALDLLSTHYRSGR